MTAQRLDGTGGRRPALFRTLTAGVVAWGSLSAGLVTFAPPAGAAPADVRVSFYAVAKVLAADGAERDAFGFSVSISGDTAAVGAYLDDDLGKDSGAAYVFQRDAGGVDTWGQVAKLTAADGAEADWFGSSVSISGDTLVVGAPLDDDLGSSSGAAYVFQRDAGGMDAWGQVAKLTAADGAVGDDFGCSVSISGDTVAVGASQDDDVAPNSGSVYVFERDAGGMDAWGQVAKLTAPDGDWGDWMGTSVAISGDTVVGGALRDDDLGSNSGAAYVFERDRGGVDAWGLVTKLTAADGAEDDNFGESVSIGGDTLVVGARSRESGTGFGSAYVFERNAGGVESWGQVAQLTAPDGEAHDYFGFSVSNSPDRVVVGAHQDADLVGQNSGSAYVFERDAGGPRAWGPVAKLTAADAAEFDNFGTSVAISGDTLIASAQYDDDLGTNSGSAYLFEETLVDPSITISGSCPGQVVFSGAALTPSGRAQLYASSAEGSDPVPGGFCEGTPLGLGSPAALGTRTLDATGAISATFPAPDSACGVFFQLVDLTSCAVSNVAQVP